MLKKIRIVLLLLVLLASCRNPPSVGTPTPEDGMPPVSIERHPKPSDYSGFYLEITSIPRFDPNSDDPWQVDLRSRDLTKIDMTDSLADLLYATFDSKTQWPAPDKIPAGFDWQKIMELGMDPGLGMRALHEQGITGKGVGIAIIDQTLLVDHVEYKDRIRVYEEASDITGGWLETQMHGPAVASIAVGKTVGVAPEADLYFIATAMCSQGTYESVDFACLAKSVRRIIEINKDLPVDRKIRALSMSIGWGPQSKGYNEITAAVNEAKSNGIFVISSSLAQTYDLHFHALGRDPLADPNKFESYVPGMWWEKDFYAGMTMNSYPENPPVTTKLLLVPMDSRTTASPTGVNDYVFYREGGWSWCIPYLAGTYALALQVKPDITPEEFWAAALETGRTIQITHEGKEYSFGVILDPQALISALQK